MNHRRPPNRPTRPLVLIVDDHDDTRELYVQSLGMFGFEAIGAADGQEACRRASESQPDIVVTDLALRGRDGWQLIQDLQRHAQARDIPVVLLTGHPSKGSLSRVANGRIRSRSGTAPRCTSWRTNIVTCSRNTRRVLAAFRRVITEMMVHRRPRLALL